MTDGDPWSAKQHNWKSEAKEDHQLSPGGPSNRRKLRSQQLRYLTAVRQEVNNLDSSVVVQELELAMNLALYDLL